jgi:hypothetical protein
MFQLDNDGDGLVDFADFQRGIAFMQRAFGLDAGVSSATNSPKLDPRLTPHQRHGSVGDDAAASIGATPQRSLSQSKLLHDVARKSGKKKTKKSSSKTAGAGGKKKKRSGVYGSAVPHRLNALDADLQSAEATESTTDGGADAPAPTASVPGADGVNDDDGDGDEHNSDSHSESSSSEPGSDEDASKVVGRKSSAVVFVQQLTPEQFGEIEKLFLKYDDGTGRISVANLELIVRRVDPGLPDVEVRKMIKSVDVGVGNGVGFQDFLRSMHALFKALRLKRALHRPQGAQTTTQALRETLRKRNTSLQRNVGRVSLLEGMQQPPPQQQPSQQQPSQQPQSLRATPPPATKPMLMNSPSSLSLLDSQEKSEEDIGSVDEALWRHVEMLEEELHAARQEIVLLSKLAKARQRESRVLGDPAEMAAWLVLQAQRDGEAGERASAALCNAVAGDERLFRRAARAADMRRRKEPQS